MVVIMIDKRDYICSMKKILYVLGFLLTITLFASGPDADGSVVASNCQEEQLIDTDSSADMQHRIDQIGRDLKSSQAFVCRRTIQAMQVVPLPRIFKITTREQQDYSIRNIEMAHRVSASVSKLQTINHSALLSGSGYQIYAFRKIII